MARVGIQNPVLALLFGSALALGTTIYLSSVIRFASRAEKAVGVVTDSYRCSGGRRSGKCGDVSFTRQDGGMGYGRRVAGASPRGAQVQVLYDPRNIEDVRVNSFFQLWFVPLMLELLGLALFGDGLRKLVLRGGAT
jgi:hypothetical protein